MAIKIKGTTIVTDSGHYNMDLQPSHGDLDLGRSTKKWRNLYISGQVNADKADIADSLETNKLYIGNNGTANGYFYSDQAGRTSFTGGSFYIMADTPNTYLYSTNTYLGSSSGDTIHFRKNSVTADDWSINANGDANFNTLAIDGSSSYNDAIKLTAGRMWLGQHSSGGGLWIETGGTHNWFAGTDTSDRYRLYHNGNRLTLGTDGTLTVAKIDTGNGATEVYDMNQDVMTNDNVDFNGVDATTYITTPMIAKSGTSIATMEDSDWSLGSYTWGGNSHARLWLKGKTPSIELHANGSTPFIDFKTGGAGSHSDHDMRIINTSNNVLEIQGGTGNGALKVNGRKLGGWEMADSNGWVGPNGGTATEEAPANGWENWDTFCPDGTYMVGITQDWDYNGNNNVHINKLWCKSIIQTA